MLEVNYSNTKILNYIYKNVEVINSQGFDYHIDYLIDSREYQNIFGEDIVIFAEKKEDGLKWTSNDLDVINSNNNIVIRTPIMYTSIDAVPKRVAGMTYVKVISPAQVIEWITNKSFQTD